ncbi:MAG: sigma-70 family RNA polymerase sigma factor [Ruminococcus sp.]|nr:sigma-70 family RNA polymerase sigma factor [Ruminococcus sp.]
MTEVETKQLFEKAVEEYSDMITGLCLVRLGNRHDAEDCYQNIFLKLFKNKEMLKEEPEYLKSWLIRVAINECKNRFRFLSRHKTEPLTFADDCSIEMEDRTILDTVMTLPEKYREVIYLFYYAGYSVLELATILDSKENTIKSRLKRGREMLKELLTDKIEEEVII